MESIVVGSVNDAELVEATISVTQYLRPHGRAREMFVDVPNDVAEAACGMVLSAEELTTGEIAIYARWEGESEETESGLLATNGPGPHSPTNVLIEAIRTLRKESEDGN